MRFSGEGCVFRRSLRPLPPRASGATIQKAADHRRIPRYAGCRLKWATAEASARGSREGRAARGIRRDPVPVLVFRRPTRLLLAASGSFLHGPSVQKAPTVVRPNVGITWPADVRDSSTSLAVERLQYACAGAGVTLGPAALWMTGLRALGLAGAWGSEAVGDSALWSPQRGAAAKSYAGTGGGR